MANFIEKTLEPGEEVIFLGKLHWSYNVRYTVIGVVLILVALGSAGAILASGEEFTAGATVCVVLAILVGFGFIGFGSFMRSRTEFAITTSRFIQKDGIFNIKMTEIPLFKVETVNFYQTIVERMLGTGSIELVGSGGTNHKVEYVQQPYKVRNLIATYMKENKDKA